MKKKLFIIILITVVAAAGILFLLQALLMPKYMSDIVEGSSMKIVEYPQVPDGPYAPNYVKYSLLGFVIGALLMTVFLIIRYLSNDTVGDENEVENRFISR